MDFDQAIHIIREQIENGRHQNTPELALAITAFDAGLPLHHCYNNDRFAVAVLCDEPIERQRMVAGLAAYNGRAEYWEWKTHFGFDTMAALKRLCIVSPNQKTPEKQPGLLYTRLYWEWGEMLQRFANDEYAPPL